MQPSSLLVLVVYSRPMPPMIPARYALLSVSDKTHLVPLAQQLVTCGYTLLSTGGTAKALREAGLNVTDVASHTGFPEMMDGRVKTLHPKIHAGILQLRDDATHQKEAAAHAIPPIDVVVVNLYPFAATLHSGADFETCIENIDVGGPAMVRAAAKNFAHVTIITDPADYDTVVGEISQHGHTLPGTRQLLAAKAFAHTAAYDSNIGTWLHHLCGVDYPRQFAWAGQQAQVLRYGENPHQSAAFYVNDPAYFGLARARQIQGKELSYNNLNDTDAAWELVSELPEAPAVAIIKHANPCGVATAPTLLQAYQAALRCDPVSAFGGIIALNKTLDAETARAMADIFTEVIIAPDATPEAQNILAAKKNLRLLLVGGMPRRHAKGVRIKTIGGGFLVQSKDNVVLNEAALKVVTARPPTPAEMADLKFAFLVAKHVKSNTIVYAKNGATVGIGAGQMSRVDAARIAAHKAREAATAAGLAESLTQGSVAASDAFFPFADGLQAVIDAGCTAVIQPGGSMRDADVIDAANNAGIAMVTTGVRHFRH